MADRFDRRSIPPSILDARSRGFGEVVRRAVAEPDFRTLLFEMIDTVDPRLFPFLIREFGIQRFVEPGMTDAVIRRLLKGSFQLHAEMGFIYGVRTGLDMLGVSVTAWQQWFQAQPQGAPGTHVAKLSVDQEVFVEEGSAITARLQRTVARMVEGMQRKSQFIALRFSIPDAVAAHAPIFVGALVRSRVRIAPVLTPITTVSLQAPVFIGAAISSRIRIAPRPA